MFVKGLEEGEVDFVRTGSQARFHWETWSNITFHVGNRACGNHSTCLQDASTLKREGYTCVTFLKECISFFSNLPSYSSFLFKYVVY